MAATSKLSKFRSLLSRSTGPVLIGWLGPEGLLGLDLSDKREGPCSPMLQETFLASGVGSTRDGLGFVSNEIPMRPEVWEKGEGWTAAGFV